MSYRISIIFLLMLGVVEAADLKALENYWALSPLREKFQHPLETLKKKDKHLEVATWYEDATITKNALPEREIFCRFLHAFTYGKNTPRSDRKELPPARAFKELTDIEEIHFYFFALIHHNKPSSPYWDKKPADPDTKTNHKDSKLRVAWTREEKAVPYLSLKVSREEWSTVSQILASRPYYSFSDFNREVCDSLFRVFPRVRSNFSELDAGLKNP